MLRIKRVYEKVDKNDGVRILIDRLWPRGLTKEKAKVDLWLKEIAPSTQLRNWFHHEPEKWGEFKEKYWQELKTKVSLLNEIQKKEKANTVTLVYSAKDKEHNNAQVLLEFLKNYEG